MACELVTAPTGGAPLSTDDYDAQNNYIQAAINKLLADQLHLTEWDTLNEPEIAQGVYVEHGGSLFRVNNSDLAISGFGVLSDGRAYISVTRVGDELNFSFTNSAVGFSWNFIYNGFYNVGGDQLLPYICIYDSGDLYKYTLETSLNKFDITEKIIVKEKIELGSWNMDTLNYKYIAFPDKFLAVYTPDEPSAVEVWDLINFVQIIIFQDSGEDLIADERVYHFIGSHGANPGGSWSIASLNSPWTLYFDLRLPSGTYFDDTEFNDTTINRGIIILEMLL